MKILLDYNPATGHVTDPSNNMMLISWPGLGHLGAKESEGLSIIKELTQCGLSVKDILELRKGKMI